MDSNSTPEKEHQGDDNQTTFNSQNETQQQSQESVTEAPLIKRGPGRPRKYPLPVHSQAPKTLYTPSATGSSYNDMFGVTTKDVQKYLMKKKVKKYVQQYLEKQQKKQVYSAQSLRQQPSHDYYDDDEEEDGQEEYSDEEENDGYREDASHSQPPPPQPATTSGKKSFDGWDTIVPGSKLAQILGRR